jgi:hypothetical protein
MLGVSCNEEPCARRFSLQARLLEKRFYKAGKSIYGERPNKYNLSMLRIRMKEFLPSGITGMLGKSLLLAKLLKQMIENRQTKLLV